MMPLLFRGNTEITGVKTTQIGELATLGGKFWPYAKQE